MEKKTKVVNQAQESYDIYIGRSSKWGNPFIIGVHGNRSEVIAMYNKWIPFQPELMESLDELEGKVLGCHCKPKACHGDVLVKLIDEKNIKKTINTLFED